MSKRRWAVTGGPRRLRSNDKTKARLMAKAQAGQGFTSEVRNTATDKVVARFTPDASMPLGWREERFDL